MTRRHFLNRSVSALLAIVMLFGTFALDANSVPDGDSFRSTSKTDLIYSDCDFINGNTSLVNNVPGIGSYSDPEALAEAESAYRERMQRECAEGILADSKIADYVSTNEFFETKPMFRLTALDTLNSYVIQNADNTNTIYLMAENVKYDRGSKNEKVFLFDYLCVYHNIWMYKFGKAGRFKSF